MNKINIAYKILYIKYYTLPFTLCILNSLLYDIHYSQKTNYEKCAHL